MPNIIEISDFSSPELDVFARLTETQLRNRIEPEKGVFIAEDRLAGVLGTEGDGLSPRTIADCDYTACIPMSHGVDSLNVAAAAAVAFWQLKIR